MSEAELAGGRQAFGLGRPLRDLLQLAEEGTPSPLFGTSDEPHPTAEVLEEALTFAATCLPDDLWGCSSTEVGGTAVTRLAGTAAPQEAWALADALRRATVTQLPVTESDRVSVCVAIPAGTGAAIGIRRAGRRLEPRELLLVQTIAGACVLAAGSGRGTTWS
jgi:hypothetical protein